MATRIQSNDPNDLYRAEWNQRKSEQQDYLSQLSGGSWSQPPWMGYHPSYGAGMSGGIVAGDEVFQRRFPRFLTGGSWFPQPFQESVNYDRLTGMGHGDMFLQRYAQDGDSGFFGMSGRGQPVGMSPFPPNHLPEDDTPIQPLNLPLASESKMSPVIVQPSAMPNDQELVMMSKSEVAEPQQHALHVPPYSHLVKTGFGKDSALYEEPFEIPEYKGSLHKKKSRIGK